MKEGCCALLIAQRANPCSFSITVLSDAISDCVVHVCICIHIGYMCVNILVLPCVRLFMKTLSKRNDFLIQLELV